jgi:hypothetical protein
VHALAHFWMDSVQAALAAEEKFPERCYRLRYEDLVADPEGTAAGLFKFLDVGQVPGISETCFSPDRERFGPADYKIWSTSRISQDSVGRGWTVPAGMIAPHILGGINELTATLGYLSIDGGWGTSEPPADLRVSAGAGSPRGDLRVSAGTGSPPADLQVPNGAGPPEGTGAPEDAGAPNSTGSSQANAEPATTAVSMPAGTVPRTQWLGDQLRAGLAAAAGELRTRWPAQQTETFVAVAVTSDPARPAEYWLVDFRAGTVTFASRDAQEHSDWDVVGSADAWEQVIRKSLNYYVALRTCKLRYCDDDEDSTPLTADTRTVILARLLGLTGW